LAVRRSARITRSPIVYWLAVAALALLTGTVASRVVSGAGALAARYGPLRPVVVAVRPLEPGSVVAADDVAVRQMPAGVVPEGALAAIADARGRTVVAPAYPGVPIVAGQLAPDGRRGLTALVPPGRRAVAVPNGRPSLTLVRGDTVDVLATFDPAGATEGAPPTFPVAVDALVVDVGDESAAVAVSPEEAARVAFALASGVVTLAVVSPVDEAVSGSSTPAGPAPPDPRTPGR
jgi:Flp pilus assembly protein CpaB